MLGLLMVVGGTFAVIRVWGWALQPEWLRSDWCRPIELWGLVPACGAAIREFQAWHANRAREL